MTYPTVQELAAMGIVLVPDIWWSDRLQREYASRQYNAPAEHEPSRAPYKSRYVGVRKRYSGWAGGWMKDGKYVTGLVRATELEAAWDRAKALGRDHVEMREGLDKSKER